MRPTSQILEQLDHEVDLVLAQLVLDVDEPTVQHQVLRQLGQTLDEPVDRVLVLINQSKELLRQVKLGQRSDDAS